MIEVRLKQDGWTRRTTSVEWVEVCASYESDTKIRVERSEGELRVLVLIDGLEPECVWSEIVA